MERERDAREKGKSSNNKSMLGKYVSKNEFKINKCTKTNLFRFCSTLMSYVDRSNKQTLD